MSPLQSLPLPLGADIIDFHLPAIDNKAYSPNDFADKKVLMIMFMCNHCPYVKAVIGRVIALQAAYAEKGLQVIGINPNDDTSYPEDSIEGMKKWAPEKGVNFPYLRDESQEVATTYHAQCTPDIYVFDAQRKLAYHGRIDDNWQHPEQVKKQELKEALETLLAGKSVSDKQNPTIGCSIKWKN